MYHKSFRTREKLCSGCFSTAGYHRLSLVRETRSWITAADSPADHPRCRLPLSNRTTRCLFSPASPSILQCQAPIPALRFILFYPRFLIPSFVSVETRLSVYLHPHCLTRACLSSLSSCAFLFSATSHSFFGNLLSLTSSIRGYRFYSPFTLKSRPSLP